MLPIASASGMSNPSATHPVAAGCPSSPRVTATITAPRKPTAMPPCRAGSSAAQPEHQRQAERDDGRQRQHDRREAGAEMRDGGEDDDVGDGIGDRAGDREIAQLVAVERRQVAADQLDRMSIVPTPKEITNDQTTADTPACVAILPSGKIMPSRPPVTSSSAAAESQTASWPGERVHGRSVPEVCRINSGRRGRPGWA